jgi:hypothetical protein
MNICVDNWYVTRETVDYLLKLKFNFVGTIQRTRLGLFFGKGCIPDIFVHKPSKKDFQRRMYVLRVILPNLPCPSPVREIRKGMTLSTLSYPKLVISGKNDIPKKCDICPS